MPPTEPAQIVERFLEFLESEYAITKEDLNEILLKREQRTASEQAHTKLLVPIDAFSADLGAFETIVKFLREAYGLSHGKIAETVGRSPSMTVGWI